MKVKNIFFGRRQFTVTFENNTRLRISNEKNLYVMFVNENREIVGKNWEELDHDNKNFRYENKLVSVQYDENTDVKFEKLNPVVRPNLKK